MDLAGVLVEESRTALESLDAVLAAYGALADPYAVPDYPAQDAALLERARSELREDAHEADVRLWASVLALQRTQDALERAALPVGPSQE